MRGMKREKDKTYKGGGGGNASSEQASIYTSAAVAAAAQRVAARPLRKTQGNVKIQAMTTTAGPLRAPAFARFASPESKFSQLFCHGAGARVGAAAAQ